MNDLAVALADSLGEQGTQAATVHMQLEPNASGDKGINMKGKTNKSLGGEGGSISL